MGHELLHDGGGEPGQLVAEDEGLETLEVHGGRERVLVKRGPDCVEQELNLIQLHAQVHAGRHDFVEILGQCVHASFCRKSGGESGFKELLEDSHQSKADQITLPLSRASEANKSSTRVLIELKTQRHGLDDLVTPE